MSLTKFYKCSARAAPLTCTTHGASGSPAGPLLAVSCALQLFCGAVVHAYIMRACITLIQVSMTVFVATQVVYDEADHCGEYCSYRSFRSLTYRPRGVKPA